MEMCVALNSAARPELKRCPGADTQPVRSVSERAQTSSLRHGPTATATVPCVQGVRGNLPVKHARIQGVSFIADAGFLYDTTATLRGIAERHPRYADTTSAFTL